MMVNSRQSKMQHLLSSRRDVLASAYVHTRAFGDHNLFWAHAWHALRGGRENKVAEWERFIGTPNALDVAVGAECN